MTVTYRVTIRPPGYATVPDGYTAIRPLVPSQQWNYGQVDYPEALAQSVADHYSIIPVSGSTLAEVVADGVTYWPNDLLGRFDPTVYAVACGTAPRSAVEDMLRAKAAEYDIEVTWTWAA